MKMYQLLKFLTVIKAIGNKVSFLTIFSFNFLLNLDTWKQEKKIILRRPEGLLKSFVTIQQYEPK